MATTYNLEAQVRTITGKKVGQLRRQGLIPGVVYGAKIEPIHVQIPFRPLEITLAKAGGNHVIDLDVDGNKQTVIARAVQRHIIRGDILHVDFLAVDATTVIRTEVQIHFENESPVVAARIGMLNIGMTSLEIESLPADLIDRVDIDLSQLKAINDSIHVRDLNLGDKITILNDPDEVIVRVAPVSSAVEEEEEEAELTSSEPEVISRGKEADEEE